MAARTAENSPPKLTGSILGVVGGFKGSKPTPVTHLKNGNSSNAF